MNLQIDSNKGDIISTALRPNLPNYSINNDGFCMLILSNLFINLGITFNSKLNLNMIITIITNNAKLSSNIILRSFLTQHHNNYIVAFKSFVVHYLNMILRYGIHTDVD